MGSLLLLSNNRSSKIIVPVINRLSEIIFTTTVSHFLKKMSLTIPGTIIMYDTVLVPVPIFFLQVLYYRTYVRYVLTKNNEIFVNKYYVRT